MKVVWSIFLTVVTLLCGLFLFQNQSRTLSMDADGHRLSFDLGLWGLVASDLSFVVFVSTTFAVGVTIGVLLPMMIKDFLKN